MYEDHSMKEAQEKLQKVSSEKVYLTKEYAKIIKFSYSIMLMAFENFLKHVEIFFLEVKISREKIHPKQKNTRWESGFPWCETFLVGYSNFYVSAYRSSQDVFNMFPCKNVINE